MFATFEDVRTITLRVTVFENPQLTFRYTRPASSTTASISKQTFAQFKGALVRSQRRTFTAQSLNSLHHERPCKIQVENFLRTSPNSAFPRMGLLHAGYFHLDHGKTRLPSLNAPTLSEANKPGVTLTLDAARSRVIAVADDIAWKQGWRRGPFMETGSQALQAGDMYCEVGPENNKVIVRAWKVMPTQ
jgi:hypothetical protein